MKYEKESILFSNQRMQVNLVNGNLSFSYEDDGMLKGIPTKCDNGNKLYVNTEKSHMILNKARFATDLDKKEVVIIENNELTDKVIKVYPIFFQKPYYKQKATLRLLIWWAIKHYFKIFFK